MNNNQTVEKLKQMRLGAMADLHLLHIKENRAPDLTADEYLALLADHQWEDHKEPKDPKASQAGNLTWTGSAGGSGLRPTAPSGQEYVPPPGVP